MLPTLSFAAIVRLSGAGGAATTRCMAECRSSVSRAAIRLGIRVRSDFRKGGQLEGNAHLTACIVLRSPQVSERCTANRVLYVCVLTPVSGISGYRVVRHHNVLYTVKWFL